MYRVAILDDDAVWAETLREKVLQYPGADAFDEVVAFTSVAELQAAAERRPIDILLMDIRLAPSESGLPDGIDLVRHNFSMSGGTQVIYVTGYDDYHSRVYQTNHVYFLLKPIRQVDLDDALDAALVRLRNYVEQPIRVRVKYVERVLLPRDITYIESKRRVLHIHVGDPDEEVETYAQLASMASSLPARFVRCHNSFLVNLDYVKEYRSDSVLLTTGAIVPISRERRPAFRSTFFAYVRSHER